MSNLYNNGGRVNFKRGGGKISTTKKETADKPKKKKNIIQRLRAKILPTFGEQFKKAKDAGKKTFKSTRDDTTKGKLEYATTGKKDVAKKIAINKAAEAKRKEGKGGGADRGAKGVYNKATGSAVSSRGQAFAKARKEGKKTFMYNGKSYSTLKKGEKPNKIMPELSGKTSKKIKRFVGANGGRTNYRGGGLATSGYGKVMKS